MASILIPPDTPIGPPPEEDRQLNLWCNLGAGEEEVEPHLLIQLQDDLARARMREAFWISLVVHLLVVIFLAMSPKIFPGMKGLVLTTPADLLRNRELTYLDLPPDMQKAPKHNPNATHLSDKTRISTSKTPTIDRKTLEALRRGSPRPPAPQAPPAQAAQMSPPAHQGAQQPKQQQAQGQQSAQLQNLQPQANPSLPMQSQGQSQAPKFPSLAGAMSPGSLIEQAARAAAAHRGGGFSGGGDGGDYGAGSGRVGGRVQGNLEVLSDTEGVDFGPYLSRVLQIVRMNWYNLIPEEARAPMLKHGKVSIQFAILKTGQIAGMKIIGPSGDVALDRAAWGGITASAPFSPLPGEFHGPYLALRFHFYYNPARGELE